MMKGYELLIDYDNRIGLIPDLKGGEREISINRLGTRTEACTGSGRDGAGGNWSAIVSCKVFRAAKGK
jgi:hypothetical protein